MAKRALIYYLAYLHVWHGNSFFLALREILLTHSRSIYFSSGKKFLVMFAGLARSLVVDLRIERSQIPSWCPSTFPFVEESVVHTNEYRRTLLASYALTAM
jgi:hypothetical protein